MDDETLQRPYTDVPDDMGRMPWDGPHKRILFESEDPDSTASGSDIQEVRPGWPPDDMCADSTQYRGSFDDRDREGLRLLSPTLQQRVLKLQKDLEEAKAESRYFCANRSENPVVTPNRPRFTSTPVPRYAGGSNWDQYREVFEAIVCSNGWDEVTAALQLIAHLDGEALNVALLVPEAQRILPGVLLKTLSAHYASPGRLAKYKRQFERMTRPPGDDPVAFAIALETLARKAFVDVDASVRLQLVRDRARKIALYADIWIVWAQTLRFRTLSTDAASGRVTMRATLDPLLDPNRPVLVGFFKLHNGSAMNITRIQQNRPTFAQCLRKMAQQPMPGNSDTIDIEQLLKQLLPVDTCGGRDWAADAGISGSG